MPSKPAIDRRRIVELAAQGMATAAICKRLGVSKTLVNKTLRRERGR